MQMHLNNSTFRTILISNHTPLGHPGLTIFLCFHRRKGLLQQVESLQESWDATLETKKKLAGNQRSTRERKLACEVHFHLPMQNQRNMLLREHLLSCDKQSPASRESADATTFPPHPLVQLRSTSKQPLRSCKISKGMCTVKLRQAGMADQADQAEPGTSKSTTH